MKIKNHVSVGSAALSKVCIFKMQELRDEKVDKSILNSISFKNRKKILTKFQ